MTVIVYIKDKKKKKFPLIFLKLVEISIFYWKLRALQKCHLTHFDTNNRLSEIYFNILFYKIELRKYYVTIPGKSLHIEEFFAFERELWEKRRKRNWTGIVKYA